MIKFRITPDRMAESCSIMDYLLVQSGNAEVIVRIAPRFIVNDAGEYVVKIVTDNDGDITELQNIQDAFAKMTGVTPKRLEKLIPEFMEAVKNIVNPPNARD